MPLPSTSITIALHMKPASLTTCRVRLSLPKYLQQHECLPRNHRALTLPWLLHAEGGDVNKSTDRTSAQQLRSDATMSAAATDGPASSSVPFFSLVVPHYEIQCLQASTRTLARRHLRTICALKRHTPAQLQQRLLGMGATHAFRDRLPTRTGSPAWVPSSLRRGKRTQPAKPYSINYHSQALRTTRNTQTKDDPQTTAHLLYLHTSQ